MGGRTFACALPPAVGWVACVGDSVAACGNSAGDDEELARLQGRLVRSGWSGRSGRNGRGRALQRNSPRGAVLRLCFDPGRSRHVLPLKLLHRGLRGGGQRRLSVLSRTCLNHLPVDLRSPQDLAPLEWAVAHSRLPRRLRACPSAGLDGCLAKWPDAGFVSIRAPTADGSTNGGHACLALIPAPRSRASCVGFDARLPIRDRLKAR